MIDPSLVHNTFVNAVRTGLREEAVRVHMISFLDRRKMVDDDVLLLEVNNAIAENTIRQRKRLNGNKPPKDSVNQVETQEAAMLKDMMVPLSEAIGNINKGMLEMRSELAKFSQSDSG